MALPRKLKNMNVFVNGTSFLDEATEVTLPKLTMKTEDYRGGGMLGEVAVDMGLEKLEMEIKFGGFMAELRKQFGNAKIDGTPLRFAGAYQRPNTGEVDAVEITARGRITEIDGGSSKVGDNTEETYKLALTYYKEDINGDTNIEIDLINHVYMVGGEDKFQAIRQAIGL